MLHFVALRESMKKMEIAAIRQSIQVKEQAKATMEKAISHLLTASKARMAVDVAWMPYEAQKISTNSKEISRVEAMIRQEHEHLVMRQEELTKLSLKKRALESLRDKRKQEFTLAQSRKEQKILDASYRTSAKDRDKTG